MLQKTIDMPNNHKTNNSVTLVGQTLQQLKNKIQLLDKKNKKLRTAIKKHENFRKFVGKTFHDVQSPLLSVRALADADELPEHKRVALKSAAISIMDINNEALSQFSPRKNQLPENSKRQPVLVSAILSDIIADRKSKYANSSIEFECSINNLNAFLCIKTSPSDFKRSISNLINNSIDSLPEAQGNIKIVLKANEEWVYIDIWDDGTGMPDDVLQKLNNGTSITHGKTNGHGLGMQQVHDMLNNNYGEMKIVSSTKKENHGTTVMLKFPRIIAPNWICNEIAIHKNSTIVILDDDKSNQQLWQQKFSYIIQKLPDIKIKYFFNGNDVIKFIKDFSIVEKENICLLCDYELINQELNGLEVIKQCEIKYSILIANHFIDNAVKKQAIQNCIKILPKELITSVSSKINKSFHRINGELINVHMVWLDDESLVAQTLITEYFPNLIIDTYSNPFEFLDAIDNYAKNTKIILDNYYYAPDGSTYKIDGITLAQQLHDKGFTNLTLLSGENFDVPDYLHLVLKSDKEKIKQLDKLWPIWNK